MTLFFVRWPIAIEAGIDDERLICPHCEDDWESSDGGDSTIFKRSRQQRRCPVCGSWTDRPGPANAV